MDRSRTFGREESRSGRVLSAFGSAFNAYALYPNPTQQLAFRRALETLVELGEHGKITFEIGTGGFTHAGEELDIANDGTERLAKRLFIHEVEALRLARPPSSDDLVEFFTILGMDDNEVRQRGGILSMLLEADVRSVATRQRGLLDDFDEDEDEPRETANDEFGHAKVMENDSRHLAETLIESATTPEEISEEYVIRYQTATELLGADDLDEKEAMVKGFVDAFFFLDEEAQVEILEELLQERDDPANTMLLDQFSGHDLAEIAPKLPPAAFAMLLDYARVATDTVDSRPEELLPMLQSADDVKEARVVVEQRVEALLSATHGHGPSSEAFVNLRAEFASRPSDLDVSTKVLRSLFAVEDRHHRFLRVARIWAGRVARALRESDFEAGSQLLQAALTDPPYSPDRQPQVDEALDKILTPDLLSGLVDAVGAGAATDAVAAVLDAFGALLVPRLVEQLANEENAAARRTLIDMLAATARTRPQLIIDHLDDPRWFVVRNLAICLGKTGRPQTVAALRGLLNHNDHRVRIESIRALVPLLGRASAEMLAGALTDRHERVRQTAIGLLKTSTYDGVGEALIAAANNDSVPAEERVQVIEMLGERGGSSARAALGSLAKKKFVVAGSARSVRDAARLALEKGPA